KVQVKISLLVRVLILETSCLLKIPPKKVVKRIRKVKKNTTTQSNLEGITISSGSGSAILDPQILNDITVNPQRGKEEAQTDTRMRKASGSLEHKEGTINEVNVPKVVEFVRVDGVQTPIVLIDFSKDDNVAEISNFSRKGKEPIESTSYSMNHFIPNWPISIEDQVVGSNKSLYYLFSTFPPKDTIYAEDC
ncbi:hypothetical protein ACH5RR_039431, partial [Cinchona calisaya]